MPAKSVCLDAAGRALFDPLLYRRAEPYFYAFNCLWLDGRDLRQLPLIGRKAILRGIVPRQPSRLLYVDHVLGNGVELYRAACAMDLEGIVAKWKDAPYGTDPPSWAKIKNPAYSQAVKNPAYSQAVGRRERFEAMRGRQQAIRGWASA